MQRLRVNFQLFLQLRVTQAEPRSPPGVICRSEAMNLKWGVGCSCSCMNCECDDVPDVKKVHISLIIAFLTSCQLVSADFYLSFTQIDVQHRMGRIAIHRGLVRDAKYVDWLKAHRDEGHADGIYVDARHGTKEVFRRTINMDDQTIELELRSEHIKQSGPGSALPSNALKVKINGVLVYDGIFGFARSGTFDVQKIQIFPIDHMLRINASQYVGASVGSCWKTSDDLYFSYDNKEAGRVCNRNWISKKILGVQ